MYPHWIHVLQLLYYDQKVLALSSICTFLKHCSVHFLSGAQEQRPYNWVSSCWGAVVLVIVRDVQSDIDCQKETKGGAEVESIETAYFSSFYFIFYIL